MNREKIVEHVKAKDRVIFWTASDLYFRYWVYDPRKDRVTYVVETCSIPEKIKWLAKKEGLKGGIWVRGLAGIAALFPVVDCSDEVAERMLLATLPKVAVEVENQVPNAIRLFVRAPPEHLRRKRVDRLAELDPILVGEVGARTVDEVLLDAHWLGT